MVKDILSLHNMLHVQAQAEVEIFLRFMLFLCAVKLKILVKLQTYKSFNIPGFDMPSSTSTVLAKNIKSNPVHMACCAHHL